MSTVTIPCFTIIKRIESKIRKLIEPHIECVREVYTKKDQDVPIHLKTSFQRGLYIISTRLLLLVLVHSWGIVG